MYRARYRKEKVAVKQFLTYAEAEHSGDTVLDDKLKDIIIKEDALFLFRC